MSILKIRTIGDPILTKIAKPVEEINDFILKLATEMIDTMIAGDGIGLAAPQVGYSIRMLAIDLSLIEKDALPMVYINPEITKTEGECEMEEGCLSVPEVFANVKRPEKIIFAYTDLDWKKHSIFADGYLARVLQHEIDHLNGHLFVEQLDKIEKSKISKKLKKIKPDGWTPKSK